jgi:CspA family cold shock protein
LATGKVKVWFEQRGFGFVVPHEGGEDVFCHIKNVAGKLPALTQGQRVQFREAVSPKSGRTEAKDVEVISS